MIHGESRIVLRNSKSGHIVKDVTSENTFQDEVLANYIYSHGIANNSPWGASGFASNQEAYISSLVGGILCFDDTITAGSHYKPGGVNMVANGCRSQNANTQPYEFGQFNSGDSVITSGKIVQVYDWDNSHGNGTIKSVCLTSDTGGFLGYGNADDVIRTGLTNNFFTKQTAKKGTLAWDSCYYNNKKYRAELDSSGQPVLREQPCGLTQGDMFEFQSKSQTFSDGSLTNTWTSCGIPLGYTETAGVFRGFPINHQSHSGRVSPNGTLYYYEFDVRNGFGSATCTKKSIVNDSAYTLYPIGSYSTSAQQGESEARNIYFAGHYMVCANFEGTPGSSLSDIYYLIFDLTTGHYKNKIYRFNWKGISQTFEQYVVGALTNDSDMLALLVGENSNDFKYWIYDGVSDTFKRFNAEVLTNQSTWKLPSHIKGTDLIHRHYNNDDYNDGNIYHNPLYLATINNLSTPVIKDASLTMKITYTLEET